MEEILSSIKRIIAEEGDVAPGRARRPGRAMTPPPRDDDEVLELSDPIPDRVPDSPRADRIPEPDLRAAPEPKPVTETAMPASSTKRPPEPPLSEPIASPETMQATRGALDQLSRLLVKPEPGADGTLEGLVRELLRPMLREWIDAHLPGMVETMVAKEIARITGSAR